MLQPYESSSLEAEDFDELSPDDTEYEEDEGYANEEADEEVLSLRDQLIGQRYKRWLGRLKARSSDADELLNQLYSRLEVRDVQDGPYAEGLSVSSSERCVEVRFSLCSMEGLYVQRSQADTKAPVWDTSNGKFEELPYVMCRLELDGEELVNFACFNRVSDPDGTRSIMSVEQERLSERFGSQTIDQIGGWNILLQFLGIICVDSGSPGLIESLPFKLTAADVVDPEVLLASKAKPKAASTGGYGSQLAVAVPQSPDSKPKRPAGKKSGSRGPPSARGEKSDKDPTARGGQRTPR